MNEEKRAFCRIPVKVVTNCMRSTAGERVPDHFISYTKDISSQGARIILSKNVESGNTITLALELPTSFIPALIHGEVVWAQAVIVWSDHCHSFTEAGIKFVDMQAMDGEKLQSFLKQKAEEHNKAGVKTEIPTTP